MNQDIRTLEPSALWNNFADLNAIPRPSKKEEQVIAFMVAFGKKLGLETIVDPIQNVIIKKTGHSWYGKQENHRNAITFGYGASKKCGYSF